MDNSIIDSCREASGEAKSLNDTSNETKILPNLLSKIVSCKIYLKISKQIINVLFYVTQ